METNDFLSAVLPTQGKYCVFISKGKLRKNFFVDTIDNVYNTCVQQSSQRAQAYFALATFDDAGYRKAENAQLMRSLFIDMDCGFEEKDGVLVQKAFPDQVHAVKALRKFLQDTGLIALGKPWLVNSGTGMHAYMPLGEDVPIARWKPAAEALKSAAERHGFPIDVTVTADAARVLRSPGTANWKTDPPMPVVLMQRGSIYQLEDLEQALESYKTPVFTRPSALMLPGTRPKQAMGPIGLALAGNSITRFKTILQRTKDGTGCGQIAYYVEHAKEDGLEPLWRGVLSLTKYCIDGDTAARKMSALHPYDEERMAQKLGDIKGPYSCVAMNSTNPGVCTKCPHWGKCTNALSLGREVQTTTEPVVYAEPESAQPRQAPHIERPEPPWGFSYGVNGGLFYRYIAQKKDEVDHDIMLLPYDLFMTNIFTDASTGERVAEFKAVKPGKISTFGIPLAKATNHADCVKALAAESIIAAHAKYDVYLTMFMRQCIVSASAEGREVDIPPRFGWLDHGDFALCDRVLSQHGPAHDYTYKSSRLGNLIEATRAQGTLEEWRRPFEMMRRKELWGHLAFAMAGFAAPLMHFMPAGARTVTMHIAGNGSGNGKSYAASMANSIFGSPKAYAVPPDTSHTTLMQRAGLLGSLHLGVDEITNKQRESDREFMPKLVFAYSAGAHKIKGSNVANAEIRNDLFWIGIMLLTSNTPSLEAMMGARGTTSEGEARRLLEWTVPKNFSMDWSAEDERDAQAINSNFGVAGAKYVEWLVTHQDIARDVCNRVLANWRRYSGAPATERYWSSGVAASVAGCILAGREYAGVIDIPATQIMDFWLHAVVQPSRAIISANQLTAMDNLLVYIRDNNHNFIRVSANVVVSGLGGQDTTENNRRLVRGRVERDVAAGLEKTYVELGLLRQHCAQRNISFTEFIRELESSAGIQQGRKNLTAGTSGAQIRVPCICLIRPLSSGKASNGGI